MSPGGDSFVNANGAADNGLIAFSQDDFQSTIAESESILDLSEFDRFVFVICVLERYSIYDCALLLNRLPRDINEARQRVGKQVGQITVLSDLSQRLVMS